MSGLRRAVSGLFVFLMAVGMLWASCTSPGLLNTPPVPGSNDTPAWQAPVTSADPTGKSTHVLLTALFYDAGPGGPPDQFLRLLNPTQQTADLSGWTLSSGSTAVTFDTASLLPGQSADLALDRVAFAREMGWEPTYAVGEPAVAGTLSIPATGGQISLRDRTGILVDAICYGAGPCAEGWSGLPTRVRTGVILSRALVEAQGWQTLRLSPDTDTAADWHQGEDWIAHRDWRPGQTFLPQGTLSAGAVTALAGEEESVQALTASIDQAHASIDANLEFLTSPLLAQALLRAQAHGTRVRLLLAGSPSGGMPATERELASQLVQAGGVVRYMQELPGGRGRYAYDHAQYLVIDRQVLLLGTASPAAPAQPLYGGAPVWLQVRSSELSRYFAAAFDLDFRLLPDVMPFDPLSVRAKTAQQAVEAPTTKEAQAAPPATGPVSVTPLLSPDHALWRAGGLLGLLDTSVQQIDLEVTELPRFWGGPSGSWEVTPNLYLDSLLRAARRGVRVRLLLDGSPLHLQANQWAAEWIARAARQESLPIEVRLSAPGRAGFHGGVILVDGERLLVTSANWTEADAASSREAGLVVTSPELTAYLHTIFAQDWGG